MKASHHHQKNSLDRPQQGPGFVGWPGYRALAMANARTTDSRWFIAGHGWRLSARCQRQVRGRQARACQVSLQHRERGAVGRRSHHPSGVGTIDAEFTLPYRHVRRGCVPSRQNPERTKTRAFFYGTSAALFGPNVVLSRPDREPAPIRVSGH
jgi:hypothetical protein